MKDKGSKLWTAGIIVVCFILLITMAAICSGFFVKTNYIDPSSFLQGEYCVDDGEWITIDPNTSIDVPFHKIVFKGTLIDPA